MSFTHILLQIQPYISEAAAIFSYLSISEASFPTHSFLSKDVITHPAEQSLEAFVYSGIPVTALCRKAASL